MWTGVGFSTSVDAVVELNPLSGAFVQVDQAEQLWTKCSVALREQVSEAVWLTTFSMVTPLDLQGTALSVAVPSSVVKERIETRYLTLVNGALADIGQSGVLLSIEVQTDVAPASSNFSPARPQIFPGMSPMTHRIC